MTNSKKKGNAGENAFANWLQGKGFKAYKNGSSGGNHNKSDIHNALGLNIEVKTVKRINLMEAWRQTDRDSSLARSEPLLAIRFDGMRQDEWLMVMHSEDWVEMMKKTKEAPTTEFEAPQDRALRYQTERAKSELQKLLRLLP